MITELQAIIIDSYALFQSPAQVMKTLRDKCGENVPTYHQVLKVRKDFRQEILSRRAELEADIPILNSKERWGYLQFVLDDSLEEKPVVFKGQLLGYERDRKSALEAIKLANAMTENRGAVQSETDEQVRTIILTTFDSMKKANPTREDTELVKELLEALGERARPFIRDLEIEAPQKQNG